MAAALSALVLFGVVLWLFSINPAIAMVLAFIAFAIAVLRQN